LRLVLGDLSGGGDQVTRVELGGLSHTAVATLARPQGLDAGELHARTGGNPFFVTEVLAAGTERIPHTVRDAVLARAARLGPAAGELLDAAAVIPGRAELWLLEKLVPAAADSLDECLGSGILLCRQRLGGVPARDRAPRGGRVAPARPAGPRCTATHSWRSPRRCPGHRTWRAWRIMRRPPVTPRPC
jgi:hypothetical protein